MDKSCEQLLFKRGNTNSQLTHKKKMPRVSSIKGNAKEEGGGERREEELLSSKIKKQ